MLEIFNHAVTHSTAIYAYEPQTLAERFSWFERKLARLEPVIVYEDGGTVAGYATYGAFRDFPAYKYTVEHSIYVAPEHQGRGIGNSLLRAVIDNASERGYRTLVAGIDAANAVSIAMHEKFGFSHSGTIHQAGFKFGRWLDLAFYQLTLDGPEEPRDG